MQFSASRRFGILRIQLLPLNFSAISKRFVCRHAWKRHVENVVFFGCSRDGENLLEWLFFASHFEKSMHFFASRRFGILRIQLLPLNFSAISKRFVGRHAWKGHVENVTPVAICGLGARIRSKGDNPTTLLVACCFCTFLFPFFSFFFFFFSFYFILFYFYPRIHHIHAFFYLLCSRSRRLQWDRWKKIAISPNWQTLADFPKRFWVYLSLQSYTHMHRHACMYACMHACACARTHKHTRAHKRHTCMHARAHTRTHVHTYVRTLRTHTHARAPSVTN